MQIQNTSQILILRDVTDGDAHETLPVGAKDGAEVTALALGTTNNLILVGTIDGGSDLTIPAGGSATLHKTGSGWWSSFNSTALTSFGTASPSTPLGTDSGGSGADLSGGTDLGIVSLAAGGASLVVDADVLATADGALSFKGVTNPAAPAAGSALLHARTPVSGVTRLEVDNAFGTNIIVGRDNVFVVKNATAGTLPKFALVYVSGADGAIPTVDLADASDAAKMPVIGTVLDDIVAGAKGQVMRIGIVDDLDLSAFTNGATVYADPANPGGATPTRPVAPNVVQAVAIILSNSDTVGSALAIIAPALLGTETGTNAATFGVTSVVDTGGTGPSLDFSSSEVVATGKGTLQTPFSVDGVSGVTVNLQEWRVDGTAKSSIGADGSLTAPNVILPDAGAPVDAVASTGSVGQAGTPGDGNTVTINGRAYTFKTGPVDTNDQVLINGGDGSLTNLEHAINNSGGVPGTDYQVATANADVTAADVGSNAIVLSAKIKGTVGDAITLAKNGANLRVNAGAGPTTLGSGIDGTPGTENEIRANNGSLYFCTAAATTATSGAWKKVTTGSLS